MRFRTKTVAITGAAGGVGQSLCRLFGREGAAIVALDKSAALTAVAAEFGAEGIAVRHAVLDLADAGAVGHAFAGFGSIDILVNNAGGSDHATFAKTDAEGWRADLERNLSSAYYCAEAVLAGMKARRSGVIIAIGSVNALSALGDPSYSAAKAGLIALTRSISQEYGRYGIRANIVLPGTVRTPLWQRRAAKDPSVLETLRKWYPLGRIVEPEEVAEAVAFLASDQASAITGVALPVDCGLSAGNVVMARELTLEDF